ncbi:sugar transferase [Egicoccus sp. AB-alg2]|uniref:sugar transferase n=1 Tax=Egicoccus sp. AB-alg2 TaxID=3242693 RepID=UPI00359E745A
MSSVATETQERRRLSHSLVVKRLLDFSIAAVGITLLSPIMAAIAVLIRLKLGTPVIYRQQRPGLGGECFELVKFRSMTDERNELGELLPNNERLTSFGRRLRASSLDELPELINVLRGEMSIVGPRPLRQEYLPLYTKRQARRHEVRPGLTGWAQVNGRNALRWEERFELDVWYVDNQSLVLDLRIIARTFATMLRGKGVHSGDGLITEPFTGSDQKLAEPWEV